MENQQYLTVGNFSLESLFGGGSAFLLSVRKLFLVDKPSACSWPAGVAGSFRAEADVSENRCRENAPMRLSHAPYSPIDSVHTSAMVAARDQGWAVWYVVQAGPPWRIHIFAMYVQTHDSRYHKWPAPESIQVVPRLRC